ncbi:MAG: transcription-repair coupling factor [Firmicutes bacterium]|nr:transcription-repair coupling factor [Bacillota bacterium]
MITNYTGISDNRTALLAGRLMAQRPGQGLVICSSLARARRIAGDLSFFSSVPVCVVPDQEAGLLRYEAKSTGELSERLSVLTRLVSGESCIAVAPILGALKKLPVPEDYEKDMFTVRLSGTCDRQDLIGRLARMGYERNSAAEAVGQFAVRGDIIDVFSPGRSLPVRIELFDDEVDSIRSYDPMTQRSVESLEEVLLSPAQLMVKNDRAYERALKGISAAYGKACSGRITEEALEKLRGQRDYLIECLEEGINPQYLEGFVSYFYEEPALLWDYIKDPSFIIIDDPSRIKESLDFYTKENDELGRTLLERHQAVPQDLKSNPDPADIFKAKDLSSDSLDIVFATPFAQQIPYTDRLDQIIHVNATQAPVFSGHMDLLEGELKARLARGYKVVIGAGSDERLTNLKEFLERAGITSGVELRYGSLSAGTDLIDDRILYISDADIFQHTKKKGRRSSRRGSEIKVFTDINKGDYVVHETHGIGRFMGVEKLTVDGSTRDYLKIRYAQEDVLYVPVDQMESIQKYVGSEGVEPKINRLSGNDWQKTKARAKAAIKDMAADFLKLSAERSVNPGYHFGPDSTWQKEFEDAFPYQETDDQLRCVEEIKKDMESDKAMDRLLCGDVGFGKTEVAARAIFKCLEEGKQAAVLVPTTILANQHYMTLTDRFSGYPFRIDMLSRFRTEKQQSQTITDLASGNTDLVIGTHRLLSKDVHFKDLGLLVIDEEQRFGVEHKEAIKQLKTNVDVLTLSATPIPRTLHMSLIGVRDMSVIEQPPEDRYPVQTYVMEQDDNTLADAIRRELGRDGQVYVVYNRVKGIQNAARHIQELVPEAKISVGHGQMSERQLEDVMMEFVSGETQILIATTIIESGLDIPNVNTMIILDADRFGLSQLYQLRGRVGRSNRMAYAYLMYKKDKVLSEIAEKRLRAIREFTEFGAGFRVAMRDLELRGAGNILGVEQSGHMLSIGYELYCKLVEEAVNELRGGPAEEAPISADTEVNLLVSAFLPETYVADELTRLAMYKRISGVYDRQARLEVTDELLDRFGDLPREAENLLDVAMIHNLGSRLGIAKVVQQKDRLVFVFEEHNAFTPELFLQLLDRFGQKLTVYGGSAPRLSLFAEKGRSPAEQALELLEIMTKKAKIPA